MQTHEVLTSCSAAAQRGLTAHKVLDSTQLTFTCTRSRLDARFHFTGCVALHTQLMNAIMVPA
jgi:hypothetical protein